MPSQASTWISVHFSIFYLVSWSALSQPMKQIDTGITRYVWATDKNHDVYLLNEEERSFKQVTGLNLVHVTSGESGVFVISF